MKRFGFRSWAVWMGIVAMLVAPSVVWAQAHGRAVAAPPGGPAAAPEHAADKPAAGKSDKEGDSKDDAEAAPTPQRIKVGIELEGLSKFEVGPATFNAEFTVISTCEKEPCRPEFDLGNGRITAKEKLVDEKLLKITKYKAEVTGYTDLSEYPFDKHVLFINLQEKSDPLNTEFTLDAKDLKLDERVKVAGWTINPKPESEIVKAKVEGGHSYQEVYFGVEIERPRTAAIFKSMVPVIFMIMVMLFTLLLKPKSAAGRLTASTGALMTLVMFHISSTASLPPLGYLTRMDKFMVANYFVYFLNIAFAVAIVRFDEQKNEKVADLTYLIALGAVPGVGILAWLLVFMRFV